MHACGLAGMVGRFPERPFRRSGSGPVGTMNRGFRGGVPQGGSCQRRDEGTFLAPCASPSLFCELHHYSGIVPQTTTHNPHLLLPCPAPPSPSLSWSNASQAMALSSSLGKMCVKSWGAVGGAGEEIH